MRDINYQNRGKKCKKKIKSILESLSKKNGKVFLLELKCIQKRNEYCSV